MADTLFSVGMTRTRTTTSKLYLAKRRNGYYYLGFFEGKSVTVFKRKYNI
jgi:hypothetical protein